MPYAVEMFFDKESDEYIRGLWRTLKSGISSYMNDSDNVPYITLSVFRSWILPMIRDWLLLRKKCQICCSASLGAFPTDEGVLFLAPIVTEELLGVHKAFQDLFDDLKRIRCRIIFRLMDSHCTLSLNMAREKIHEALDAVIKACKPIIAEVDRVGLVEYHPVKVLKEYKFKE